MRRGAVRSRCRLLPGFERRPWAAPAAARCTASSSTSIPDPFPRGGIALERGLGVCDHLSIRRGDLPGGARLYVSGIGRTRLPSSSGLLSDVNVRDEHRGWISQDRQDARRRGLERSCAGHRTRNPRRRMPRGRARRSGQVRPARRDNSLANTRARAALGHQRRAIIDARHASRLVKLRQFDDTPRSMLMASRRMWRHSRGLGCGDPSGPGVLHPIRAWRRFGPALERLGECDFRLVADLSRQIGKPGRMW